MFTTIISLLRKNVNQNISVLKQQIVTIRVAFTQNVNHIGIDGGLINNYISIKAECSPKLLRQNVSQNHISIESECLS